MTTELAAWSEKQRLYFIERLLFWKGSINRRDLCGHFGTSPPQATNDIVKYTTMNPGACTYNVRSKRYEATEDMVPVLLEPDFGEDHRQLGAAGSPEGVEDFVVRPDHPVRIANTKLFRQLSLAAHRKHCLDVRYWSVSTGSAARRAISPRTFGHDGLRWHVRAYCHNHGEFRDFNIGRMKDAQKPRICPEAEKVDAAWHTWLRLHIRPNPQLEANQRRALEMDYGMKRGKMVVPVREAMALYTRRRLGFVKNDSDLPQLNETKQLEWFGMDRKQP
ncbi:MAG: WYL domain-containing protein [Opitutales bacterium]